MNIIGLRPPEDPGYSQERELQEDQAGQVTRTTDTSTWEQP